MSAATTRALDEDVSAVLAQATEGDGVLFLPADRLDPALYKRIDKALKALGGRWDKRSGGHVFAGEPDPFSLVKAAVDAAAYLDPRLSGYFPTPETLAWDLVMMAAIRPGDRVLEPSAGRGALADKARELGGAVDCCELLDANVSALRAKGHNVIGRDFLIAEPLAVYDRIVMNPPFNKGEDAKHLVRAWHFLKPGGRMLAIFGQGVTYRGTKADESARDLIRDYGWDWALPEDSFKEVGTRVSARVAMLDKPECADAGVPS